MFYVCAKARWLLCVWWWGVIWMRVIWMGIEMPETRKRNRSAETRHCGSSTGVWRARLEMILLSRRCCYCVFVFAFLLGSFLRYTRERSNGNRKIDAKKTRSERSRRKRRGGKKWFEPMLRGRLKPLRHEKGRRMSKMGGDWLLFF